MIDLETFDTSPTAAIVQVGIAAFAPFGVECHQLFDISVTLQSSILAGCSISSDTVGWWRKQSEAAKMSISRDTVSLHQALVSLANVLPKDAVVWSHGASFDIPVLEHAFRAVGEKTPWDHRNVRDTRTVFWLAERYGWKKPKREVPHVAILDALQQAQDVQSALAGLRP